MRVIFEREGIMGQLVTTGEVVDLTEYDVLPSVRDIAMNWYTKQGIPLVQFTRPGIGWRFSLSNGEIVKVLYSEEEERKLASANAAYNSFRGKPSYY